MMMTTEVLMRAHKQLVEVDIDDGTNPDVNELIKTKWQSLMNLSTKIFDVNSCLIMSIKPDAMEVFLADEGDRIYKQGASDKLKSGLYCETVIAEDKELEVVDALSSDIWKDNPDVKYGMVSYYGLPLKWADGSFFGTICVLDDKPKKLDEVHKQTLRAFKDSIEVDLELLKTNIQLTNVVKKDSLTNIYNRLAIMK